MTIGTFSFSLTGILLFALLTADGLQLTPPLPHAGHRFPQFLVRDVQIALRLLDVGVTEHQLDCSDVHSIAQEPTGALVTQVVPVQVDLPELLAVDARTGLRAFRVVAVCDEQQRLPRRLEAVDVFA